MTFRQVDQERRTLRGVIAKQFEDLAGEAHRATDSKVAATFWRLAGRLESVMKKFGIERETGARRNS